MCVLRTMPPPNPTLWLEGHVICSSLSELCHLNHTWCMGVTLHYANAGNQHACAHQDSILDSPRLHASCSMEWTHQDSILYTGLTILHPGLTKTPSWTHQYSILNPPRLPSGLICKCLKPSFLQDGAVLFTWLYLSLLCGPALPLSCFGVCDQL